MLLHKESQRHYPLPYHGDKTDIQPRILKEITRIFELPDDFFLRHQPNKPTSDTKQPTKKSKPA